MQKKEQEGNGNEKRWSLARHVVVDRNRKRVCCDADNLSFFGIFWIMSVLNQPPVWRGLCDQWLMSTTHEISCESQQNHMKCLQQKITFCFWDYMSFPFTLIWNNDKISIFVWQSLQTHSCIFQWFPTVFVQPHAHLCFCKLLNF